MYTYFYPPGRQSDENCCHPWNWSYPVYQPQFVKLDPARHKLIPEGHQSALVAEHEFSCSHGDQSFRFCLPCQQVNAHPSKERHVFDYIRDALQQNTASFPFFNGKSASFRPSHLQSKVHNFKGLPKLKPAT